MGARKCRLLERRKLLGLLHAVSRQRPWLLRHLEPDLQVQERRDKIRSLAHHHLDVLIIQWPQMLDRGDARAQGIFQPLPTVGVRRDRPAERSGFCHDSLDLVQRKLAGEHAADPRAHPSGRGDLDEIRPGANQPPRHQARLIDAVADAVRCAGEPQDLGAEANGVGRVGEARGLGDDRQADEDARTGE